MAAIVYCELKNDVIQGIEAMARKNPNNLELVSNTFWLVKCSNEGEKNALRMIKTTYPSYKKKGRIARPKLKQDLLEKLFNAIEEE